MKKLIRKLTAPFKKVDLDNDGKIESYKDEIKGLFSQFETMRQSLLSANGHLQDVVTDELNKQKLEQEMLERTIERTNAKLAESKNVISKAEQAIQVNTNMYDKVSEFTV